jgi:hypothetical protein
MYKIPNIPLDTRVYEIRKDDSNLDKILAYQRNKKEFISYTFQTRREIPKVLEIYRESRDEYYPAAFIIPSPSPEMNVQPIPFDGYFALVVGYTKEIPSNLPLYNLFLTYHIEITEKKNKLEMRINGFIGLDILRVLDILQNHKDPEKYISYLKKEYILYLENITNLDDLDSFIKYNKEYLKIIGKNKILRYNEEYLRSIGENKIIKKGWFILIDNDTSKNNKFTPNYVKIFEMFV